ncbi:YidH family protein [Barrientosiimonas humi]|uniref:YidH family protein n=1 Tax=Barrientosiimonas humi TaxID=999931 RepID=UPI00370D026C
MSRARVPKRIFEVGEEPDPRFSLANERTFLAWIRTSLALLAGGVAVEVVSLDIAGELQLVAAVLLVLAGIGAALRAWFGWSRAERAMRLGEPLPSTVFEPLLVGLVAGAGLLLLIGTFLE